VYLCVAQTQILALAYPTKRSHKSGDQDVDVTEKKQFPVSGFSGG